ncbi:hypothetical protein N2152v2_001942 [Parachlorella kessleri]
MAATPNQPAGNGSATGISAAAAAAAAGQAASKGTGSGQVGKELGAGIAKWWQSLTASAAPVKGELQKAAKGLQSRTQGWTMPSMPVDVKVDFLRPTAEAVKETFHNVWVQLPPPMQQAAPYVGVAMGSGLLVFAVQQQRIKRQRKRTEEVRLEVQTLLKERTTLLQQIRDLHDKPRTDMELRLSKAVAEATNAAAAAAEAAAHAAVACVVLACAAPCWPPLVISSAAGDVTSAYIITSTRIQQVAEATIFSWRWWTI